MTSSHADTRPVRRFQRRSGAQDVMDEPESALSFSSCLALVGVLADLAARGGQALCATHSPVLTALPGATVLELGEEGYAQTAWERLELVEHWRRYLADPRVYLRHVLDG